MNTIKQLSLIALVSLMSSTALPVGRDDHGIYHGSSASDVYSSGPATFDSQGLSQPVYLDSSDTYKEGASSVVLESKSAPRDTITPMLGQGGRGILNPKYQEYKNALHGIATYKARVAKYNEDVKKGKAKGGVQVRGYDKYRKDLDIIRNYENPVTSTSNVTIA